MNENYFEIPTVENCYYAGLIATDGCISDFSKSKRLSLELTDKQPVYNLHKKLGLKINKHIHTRVRKPWKKSYNLRVCSNKLCRDLKQSWNITPRKSLTLKPPNIEDLDHIKAFLIGVIDGDGCISWSKRNKCFVLKIYGASKRFISWCKKYLSVIGEVKERPKVYNYRPNLYFLEYDADKARKILKNLQVVNVPKLKRKWGKI